MTGRVAAPSRDQLSTAFMFDGTTWTAATTINTNWVDSVACAARDFCVAAVDDGEDNGVTLAN
jgi:hypothetical protein